MVRVPSGLKIKKSNVEKHILFWSAARALSPYCSSMLLIQPIWITYMEQKGIWHIMFLFSTSIQLFETFVMSKQRRMESQRQLKPIGYKTARHPCR